MLSLYTCIIAMAVATSADQHRRRLRAYAVPFARSYNPYLRMSEMYDRYY